MAATIVGNTGPVTNGLRRSWTRGEGHTTVRTIEGPYTQVEALYNEYAAAGSASGVDQMTLDKIGAKGVLTCTTFDDSGDGTGGGNTAAFNAEWELAVNTIYESVEENAYFAGVNTVQFAAARRAALESKDLPESVTEEKAKVLYYCLRHGVTDIPVAAPVVRSNLIVNSRSAVTASFAAMFTAISTTALQALIPGEYGWKANLTANWQWLVQPPQVRKMPGGRYQITQEYWGSKGWLSYFYKGGTRTLPPTA